MDPRFAYRGEDVVQTLERVWGHLGYPKTIRVDNGSEFISRDLDLWAYANDVTLDFSRPGKPTDSGFIEAFNSKLRAECLNAHCFMGLADAREKLDAWRRDYNDVRPHSAIGYKVPSDMHDHGGVASASPWSEPETPISGGADPGPRATPWESPVFGGPSLGLRAPPENPSRFSRAI